MAHRRIGSAAAAGMLLGLPAPALATHTEPEVPAVVLELERPPPPEPPPPEPPPPEPPPPEGPGPVELLPPLSLARVAGIELPRAPRPSDPEEVAEERLDRDLRGILRRDAISSGRVDGYFHDLGRAMRSELEVDPLDMQADMHRGLSPAESLVRELGRYGSYERPIEPRGTPLPEMRGLRPGSYYDPYEFSARQQFDFDNFLNGRVTWYRVEVRVLQNRSGEVFDAQLLHSSGLPTVDRAALRAARRAVLEAPPPEDVIEGRETISSDWAVEVGDVATPYGQAGCVDPTTPTTGGCGALGRGILRFRIELLDVVDGEHPPDP